MTSSDLSGRCSGYLDPLCFREIADGIAKGLAHGALLGQGQEHWPGCSADSFVPWSELSLPPPETSVDPSVNRDAPFQTHILQPGSREPWPLGSHVDPGTDIQRDTSHPW